MYFLKMISYLFHIECCKGDSCIIKCCDKDCFIIKCENNEKKEILSIDEEWQNILEETKNGLSDTKDINSDY